MGGIVAAPSFNKLDKNCPQPAPEQKEEIKVEKKLHVQTQGLKFGAKKKQNQPASISPTPV
jgi:hypothetical protein